MSGASFTTSPLISSPQENKCGARMKSDGDRYSLLSVSIRSRCRLDVPPSAKAPYNGPRRPPGAPSARSKAEYVEQLKAILRHESPVLRGVREAFGSLL